MAKDKLTISKVMQLQDLNESVLQNAICLGFVYNILGSFEKTYIFECQELKYKIILPYNYNFNHTDSDLLFQQKKIEKQIFI